MKRVEGTAARQLDLIDVGDAPDAPRRSGPASPLRLHLLRKDLYAELTRRRRRAQMAARKAVRQELTPASA